MEKWKYIEGYPDYMVSDTGRIKSLKFGMIKYPKIHQDDNGYRWFAAYLDGKRKKFKIGRLVAKAFIPNPNNLPTVDHIDRNSLNDNLENLRWVTQGDNNRNRVMPDRKIRSS